MVDGVHKYYGLGVFGYALVSSSRQNHMIRFGLFHHSSDNFNLGTAVRNGWFTIFYKPFFYVWIVIIGFPPEMLVVCMGIEALWQFQLHTQYVKKIGVHRNF
jgi:sterol desaturase/sphingolipid hydroxylase (fatty acid hydroxylase superfamily)